MRCCNCWCLKLHASHLTLVLLLLLLLLLPSRAWQVLCSMIGDIST
jgi:hypothetical protein